MAFKTIEKGTWGATRAVKPDVRVTQSSNQFGVYIPRKMMEAIGTPERVHIAIGDGNDAGWLAIFKANGSNGHKVHYQTKGHGSAASIKIGAAKLGTTGKRIYPQTAESTATSNTIYVEIAPAIQSGVATNAATRSAANGAVRIAAE